MAVIGSGIYIAVEETVEKAAIAELLPREQRSLGFGILASANAVGVLPLRDTPTRITSACSSITIRGCRPASRR